MKPYFSDENLREIAVKLGAEGAIAAPIIWTDGTLEGTIRIAKLEPYEFTSAEHDQLLRVGKRIAQLL